jgi:hypothetical protein
MANDKLENLVKIGKLKAEKAALSTCTLPPTCAADRLSDDEIPFRNNWLTGHVDIANTWPGEVPYERARAALVDGVIDDSARSFLIATLESLIGRSLKETSATSGLPFNLSIELVVGRILTCITT